MKRRRIIDIMLWELEEFYRFPRLELIAAASIFLCLMSFQPTLIDSGRDIYVFMGSIRILLAAMVNSYSALLVLILAPLISLSLAGDIEKGAASLMLSYPVKRHELLLAKFSAGFMVTLAISIASITLAPLTINFSLLSIAPLPAAFLALTIRILLISATTTLISLVSTHAMTATLMSLLSLFSMSFLTGMLNPPYRFILGDAFVIIKGLSSPLHPYSFEDLLAAFLAPIITSFIMLAVALAYFKRMDLP